MSRLAANGIFLTHIAVGIFFLVGWYFTSIAFIYLPLLMAWPLSWLFLGYCPLSKWEFMLRQQRDPSLDTDAEVIQYYVAKWFGIYVPSRPIFIGGIAVFCILIVLSLGRLYAVAS